MTTDSFGNNWSQPSEFTQQPDSTSNLKADCSDSTYFSNNTQCTSFPLSAPSTENCNEYSMLDGHSHNTDTLISLITSLRKELALRDKHLNWLENELKRTKKLVLERERNIDQLKSVLAQKLDIMEEHNNHCRHSLSPIMDMDTKVDTNVEFSLTDGLKATDMSFGRVKKKGVSGESFSKACKAAYATYEKDEKSLQLIYDAILSNEFLNHLESSQVSEIARSMYKKQVECGCFVIKEGEPGDALYVLADGLLEVTRCGHFLGIMAVGRAFGEIALLYNCKRTASVKAISNTKLWALSRHVYQQIMMKSSRRKHKENLKFLQSVPVFRNLSQIKLHKLADVLQLVSYGVDEYIIRQGEVGETFYIIHTGSVRVTMSTKENEQPTAIRVLGTGEWFGERALYTRERRSANVISISPCVKLLCLDKSNFIHLIGDVNAIKSMEYPDPPRPETSSNQRYNSRISWNGIEIFAPMDMDSAESSILSEGLLEKPAKSNVLDNMESTSFLSQTITFSDLIPLKMLGIGGFGRVKLVVWKYDQTKTFALKSMAKKHIVSTRQQEHIMSERNLMFEIKSPFVCRLYATFRDSKYIHMLMEACLGGEIWTILRNRGSFDDTITRFILASVLEAFTYLHKHQIVYRDLKPENLLLDEHGYLKLCDFGFAKKIPLGRKTWTFCGTPEYVAPEVILNKGHDYSVDYWSLGILMFELLTGSPPFTGVDPMKIYNIILLGINVITFPPAQINRTAMTLIHRLCEQNPVERLGYGRAGIDDIRQHKYFQGFDWAGLCQRTLHPPILPKVYGPTDASNFDNYPEEVEIPLDENSGWDIDF